MIQAPHDNYSLKHEVELRQPRVRNVIFFWGKPVKLQRLPLRL